MFASHISWLLCFIASLWLGYYHWKRRKLYRLAAKIPGPPAFPLVGSAYLFISFKDIFQNFLTLVEKWPPPIKVWMFGVLVVVVTDPKHNQIVLKKCLEKEKRYDFIKDALGESLLTAEVSIWKNHRRIINPAFNQKILDSFMDVFVKQSDALVEQLKKELGKKEVFDVHEYLSCCAWNIISGTAMGISLETQKNTSKIMDSIRRASQLLLERAMRLWLHPDIIFRFSKRGRELAENLKFLEEYTGNLMMKRYKEFHSKKEQPAFDDNEKKPFLEHLLTLGDQLTFLELRNEMDLIFAAGSDTITSTISYALVCLGMHQHIQKRVVEELEEIFGKTGRQITLEDLPKLMYMERVIKETMRLYPPVPFIARSVTEDTDLGDFTMPVGCSVVVAIIGTHRDPRIWPDPEKFEPDRFSPKETAKRHPYSFIPFSGGPRNCIGIKFAMMSMKVMLTAILRSYKIDTNIKPENIRISVEIVSKMTDGSNISITKRQR